MKPRIQTSKERVVNPHPDLKGISLIAGSAGMRTKRKLRFSLVAVALLLALAVSAGAQTSSFTYQGRLNDNAIHANGTYEMLFSLFDAQAGGNQIGSTISIAGISVIDGIFTVNIDFGEASFSGADRYLQIAVRAAGNPNPHTTLTPRQAVASTPYSVKSLNSAKADFALTAMNADNANQLGGLAANQYVLTVDPRLTDSRNPNSGSAFYVQNRTTQQASTNFNVSGNGTAGGTLSGNIVNSTTNFNINGNRILSSAGTDNLFIGINAGINNTGFANTAVGRSAGPLSTSGNFNSFFGNIAGGSNTTGSNNTFVGRNSGTANTVGSNNTIVGSLANTVGNNLTFATAIGAGATVSENNTIALGRSDGSDRVSVPGDLSVEGSIGVSGIISVQLADGGVTPVCAIGLPGSSIKALSNCSSSIRYKTAVRPFTSGLSLLSRLRPVTYNWKSNGLHDIGFIAEEVAEAEPLLATYNERGQIEGVKYGQITTVLVNSVKELRAQIELQQDQMRRQQSQIDQLKKLACRKTPQTEICR